MTPTIFVELYKSGSLTLTKRVTFFLQTTNVKAVFPIDPNQLVFLWVPQGLTFVLEGSPGVKC